MLTRQDEDQLNLLGIFYYVWAGLTVAGGAVSFLMFIIMFGTIFSRIDDSGPQARVAGGFMAFMVVFMIVIVALSVGFAALHYYCGRFLRERRHRTFCFVIAALTCLSIPLGTILGIFTIVVLSRPTVQQAFAANE